MSKKHTEAKIGAEPEQEGAPIVQPASIVQPPIVQPPIVQPMIDELMAQSPPELPTDDETPPPRGPLHPPQPAEHHHRPEQPEDSDDSGDI